MPTSPPNFETIRTTVVRLLGDAQDGLRSDWQATTPPTAAQLAALSQARPHLARPKNALDRAGS